MTPGLVDCHVHAFRWGHLISLDVDPVSSQSGVTTFVDGGSAGSLQFMAFRRFVIDHVRSNLYALLNVSALGETVDGLKGVDAWENDDLRFLHLDSAVETVEKNRDLIVGIKVRIHTGLASLLPMAAARALADAVGLPLVVHAMKAPPLFCGSPSLSQGRRRGHAHVPPRTRLSGGPHGKIAPEYLEARKRGVLFDTGTARFHTCHPVARAAIAEGFLPDTISTDLCLTNYQHITIDMPTTLTKFMALGLSLEQVLQRATIEPAKSLPAERGHGRLAEGLAADIGLFAIEAGEFTYHDFFGNPLQAGRRLICRGTIKDGRLLTPEAQEPMPLSFMRR